MKNRTLFLFVMLIIPVLIISTPGKNEESLLRRAVARVSIDVCRQTGYKDFRLFKCFVVLNKSAEQADMQADDQTFAEVYTSEMAIDDKLQDESTIFRTAVRECLESERGFKPSHNSAIKVISCVENKGFTTKDANLMAEEDTRRRMLNKQKFDPKFTRLLEELKKDPFINDDPFN